MRYPKLSMGLNLYRVWLEIDRFISPIKYDINLVLHLISPYPSYQMAP